MGSPHGSFDEEGEIFESDVEKAPPSLPSVSGPSVDRHSSRIPRGSASPARSPYGDRYSNRDRRNNGDYPPRGEKRRRSREDDLRSHRVHYEANHQRDVVARRPPVSYADIDRSDTREISFDDPPDDRFYREPKRSRTRSRSPPFRGPRPDRGGGRRCGPEAARFYYGDRRRDIPDSFYDSRDGRYGRFDSGRRRTPDRLAAERGERPAPSDRPRRDTEAHTKHSGRRVGRDGAFSRRRPGEERCV